MGIKRRTQAGQKRVEKGKLSADARRVLRSVWQFGIFTTFFDSAAEWMNYDGKVPVYVQEYVEERDPVHSGTIRMFI
jgi:hypothetical protein